MLSHKYYEYIYPALEDEINIKKEHKGALTNVSAPYNPLHYPTVYFLY